MVRKWSTVPISLSYTTPIESRLKPVELPSGTTRKATGGEPPVDTIAKDKASYNMLAKSQLNQFCNKRKLPIPVFKLLPQPDATGGPLQVQNRSPPASPKSTGNWRPERLRCVEKHISLASGARICYCTAAPLV
jgi:hypothetical protein